MEAGEMVAAPLRRTRTESVHVALPQAAVITALPEETAVTNIQKISKIVYNYLNL